MEQQIEQYLPQIVAQNLPAELVEIVNNSGIQKAEYHAATFAPFMIAVKEFSNKAASLNKEAPGQLDAQIARQIRLAMVKNRTAADQAKDQGKAGLIAEGNLIQSLFNVVVSTSKLVEADLTAIEKHAELKEQARQSALRLDRMSQLEPYLANPEIYPLGTMTDEAFENLLTGSRLALEQKQLAEQQAELERVRVENERLAEQERLRVENEELKRIAEERQQLQSIRLAEMRAQLPAGDNTDLSFLWQLSADEYTALWDNARAQNLLRQAEADRIQAEQNAQAELDRIAREAKLAEVEESNRLAREKAAALQAEKEEAERVIAESQRVEQERQLAIVNRNQKRFEILEELGLKLNPETQNFFNLHLSVSAAMVKDIDDATFETQLAGWKHHIEVAEQEAADILAKKLAEIEAAKAPDKDKLKAWVNAVSMPSVPVATIEAVAVANEIDIKFNSFKSWALQQIEAL